MNEKLQILTELATLSPMLATLQNVNVYEVEQQYFENLLQEVMGAVIMQSLPINPLQQTVPLEYFENLATNILQKIKLQNSMETVAEETNEISTLVASISNKNMYKVPQGYFSSITFLPNKIEAKVVQFTFWNKLSKYAAAAVFVGLLGLAIFMFIKPKNVDNASAQILLQANDILNKGSFDAELNTLSDKDLETYLTANGLDVNAALVATTVNNDVTLPEAEDYFLDDNTLDDFLKTNNLQN